MLLNSLSPSAPPLVAPASGSMAVGRVLLVQESSVGESAVASTLRDEGFEVLDATCGADALAIRDRCAIDAVVLNLAIPETQSFEICRNLKALSPQMLPVLYLASQASQARRVRALEAGLDGYVAPFEPRELLASVAALVRRRRAGAAVAVAALAARARFSRSQRARARAT